MAVKVANNAYSTLAASITSSATSITLTSGEGARFPALTSPDYFYATLLDSANNLEIVKCTARSTDVLTVTRAQESTTGRAYTSGDRIELRITAGVLDAIAEMGGGATGGGNDKVFMENELVVTTNYTLSTNKSAVSVGPVTFNTGISLTIPTGYTWVVL
jgi:hypothetical protein